MKVLPERPPPPETLSNLPARKTPSEPFRNTTRVPEARPKTPSKPPSKPPSGPSFGKCHVSRKPPFEISFETPFGLTFGTHHVSQKLPRETLRSFLRRVPCVPEYTKPGESYRMPPEPATCPEC